MGIIEYTLPLNCASIHLPFKKACQDLHITYEELADGSGVPISNISKFMSGIIKNPNIDNIVAMARFLNSAAGRTVV